jgi:hypothetical protein
MELLLEAGAEAIEIFGDSKLDTKDTKFRGQ